MGGAGRVAPGQVESDVGALGELQDGQVTIPAGTVLMQVPGGRCPASPRSPAEAVTASRCARTVTTPGPVAVLR